MIAKIGRGANIIGALSYNQLKDKDGITEYDINFRGYDGNDSVECKLMGYARYFVVELKRFGENRYIGWES